MTLTTHAAIGAVIGMSVGNPVAGFVLGAASHFLVDMIPHGDMHISDNFRVHHKKQRSAVAYATLDAGVGILLLTVLGAILPNEITQSPVYVLSIFGSVLPDVLVGINDLYKTRLGQAYAKFHFYFHDFFCRKHGDVKLAHSLVGQLCMIAILVYWLQ